MGLFGGKSDTDKEIKRLAKEAESARVDAKFAKTKADFDEAERKGSAAAKERDRLRESQRKGQR